MKLEKIPNHKGFREFSVSIDGVRTPFKLMDLAHQTLVLSAKNTAIAMPNRVYNLSRDQSKTYPPSLKVLKAHLLEVIAAQRKPGRPRIKPIEEPKPEKPKLINTKHRTVTLDDASVIKAKQIGHGKLSAGIRKAVAAFNL